MILLSIPNFKTAGSQYVVLSLYENLKKRGIDIKVLVYDHSGYFPDLVLESDRLVFSAHRDKGSILSAIKNIYRFLIFLRKNKIALLHSWDYRSEFWEVISCRIMGIKYIYTKKNNSWSKKWMLKSLLSNHIAYDNPKMKDSFFSLKALTVKATFVPHGINIDKFNFLRKGKKGKHFIVGSVGVICENKNQLILLRALEYLPDNYMMVFYGNEDPVYKRKLDLFIDEKGLHGRVKFFGSVANDKMPNIIRSFDVLVLSSYQEAFGVVLLEAMAVGTYCIASHSGGGTEFVLGNGEFGDLFLPDDFKQLAQLLLNVERDYHRVFSKIVKARERVERLFTDKHESDAYLKLYNKMLSVSIL